MNQDQSSSRRRKTYDKLSDDERCITMDLKSQGVSCQEIARRLNKNLKTIQSVHGYERKSEYKGLKEAVTRYGIDQLLQNTSIQSMNEKKLRKLIISIVKEVIPPQNNSMFAHLIPTQKIDSNKRRIIDQIVNNILDIIQNYLKTGELMNVSDTRSDSKSDSLCFESSDHSYSTNNIIQDNSDAFHSHNTSDNCNQEVFSYQYNYEGEAEMNVEFEISSIIFSNHDMFEKSIEELSASYFSF
ncbi:unnamed protein product (macronuclear) [Paramecium tetraurelia]|uniref:Transposase IS30-like HTH domain-containing protein n=1 Tax=Paramecium tetraurelia TaxID=5888 RepID=A0CYM0_PARTE|nr:uncharacterized protein GSPATT00011488001 [Paramecium tetraurelia]CAK75887.1 unnamed protein product [Paramecium tetraurelia]|eukprot:XP_001443284.1 hypothetical protein (macronuclear) [Paramecium tetraurelia strain d4-2]